MDNLSYRGEVALKEQTLERLRAAEKAGTWVAQSTFWNGKAGSVVGVVLQGDDLDAWQRQLGLPKWLALAVDHVLITAPTIEEGARRGIDLMNAIPVGADLRSAGSHAVMQLLEGGEWGITTIGPTSALREMLQAVAQLHRQRITGSDVLPAQWREARRAAVMLADSMPKESLDAAIASCIEAATWDPSTSRTAVTDTISGWSKAMMAAAQARNEWTGPERDRMQALLRQVHAEARDALGDDSVHIDVFKELKQKHPDQWAVLKSHIDLDNAQTKEQVQLSWRQMSDTLRQALTVAGAKA